MKIFQLSANNKTKTTDSLQVNITIETHSVMT